MHRNINKIVWLQQSKNYNIVVMEQKCKFWENISKIIMRPLNLHLKQFELQWFYRRKQCNYFCSKTQHEKKLLNRSDKKLFFFQRVFFCLLISQSILFLFKSTTAALRSQIHSWKTGIVPKRKNRFHTRKSFFKSLFRNFNLSIHLK